MKKNISFISIILITLLIFTSCADNYVIDESKTAFHKELYNDIEKIKSYKEDPASSKRKEEFLKLFEQNAGFSLPSSFKYPPIVTSETGDPYVIETSSCFSLFTHFIVEKNDALKILNFVKKDDNWRGYLYWRDNYSSNDSEGEKDKENCTYFEYGPLYTSFDHANHINLNFHYNKNYDNYTVMLQAFLSYDPLYMKTKDASYQLNPSVDVDAYFTTPDGNIIN